MGSAQVHMASIYMPHLPPSCTTAPVPNSDLFASTSILSFMRLALQKNEYYSPLYHSPDMLVSTFLRIDLALLPVLQQWVLAHACCA